MLDIINVLLLPICFIVVLYIIQAWYKKILSAFTSKQKNSFINYSMLVSIFVAGMSWYISDILVPVGNGFMSGIDRAVFAFVLTALNFCIIFPLLSYKINKLKKDNAKTGNYIIFIVATISLVCVLETLILMGRS